MIEDKKVLFLFNLSMDLDNPILATTNLWANEFAKHFEHVYVYSTHVGRHEVPKNVKVTELGGGSLGMRIIAVAKLSVAFLSIMKLRRRSIVFHHQSPFTSVFPGLILHITGIRQGLWYSHSSKPISLVLGAKFVDRIFSSSPASLPLSSEKANFFGHGIDTVRAKQSLKQSTGKRSGILYIGRISPIKKLEECINAIVVAEREELFFLAIGPTDSKNEYLNYLLKLAKNQKVNFRRELPIDHELVFERMAQSNMFFAGMRNSVDKSCLEAAVSGCFVITNDQASADLSGMSHFWQEINGKTGLPELSDQIRIIVSANPQILEKYRLDVSSKAADLNSVTKLVGRISSKLKEI